MHKAVFGISVVGRRLLVEIKESREELEKAVQVTNTGQPGISNLHVKYAAEASSKERLQILYWRLKTGQVRSRRTLAKLLGRDRATVTRWLKQYQSGEYKGLLEVKYALL